MRRKNRKRTPISSATGAIEPIHLQINDPVLKSASPVKKQGITVLPWLRFKPRLALSFVCHFAFVPVTL
jgi:hypothetical protein